MGPPVSDDDEDEVSFIGEVSSPNSASGRLRTRAGISGSSSASTGITKRSLQEKKAAREAEENRLNQMLLEAGFDPTEYDLHAKRVRCIAYFCVLVTCMWLSWSHK